jgi:hypothetical protein
LQRRQGNQEDLANLLCSLRVSKRVTQRKKVDKKTTSWGEVRKVSSFLPLLVCAEIKAAAPLDKEDFMDVIRSGVNIHV